MLHSYRKGRKIYSLIAISCIFALFLSFGIGVFGICYSTGGQNNSSSEIGFPLSAHDFESHGVIYIDGNDALDDFCSGNGTNGLTSSTRHVIENYYIHGGGVGSPNSCLKLLNISRFLTIENLTLTQSGGSHAGLWLINCTNIIIHNTTIIHNNGQGIIMESCSKIDVDNCTIHGSIATSASISNSIDLDFTNNNISGNAGAFYLGNVNQSTIHSNVIEYSSESSGIIVSLTEDIQISENNITHNLARGILIVDSKNILVYRNNLSVNTDGMRIQTSEQVTCCNNIIDDNNNGVYTIDISNTTFSANEVNSNNNYGFYIVEFLNPNPKFAFIANEIVGNGRSGIYCYNMSRSKVVENNISYNTWYGMEFGPNSTQNYIWSNAFGYNGLGGVNDNSDSVDLNYWNWSTTGNWYSDYLDKYPGASQSGGRWSEDYVLSPKNIDKDYNPLVDPILISDPEVIYIGVLKFEENSVAVDISWAITDMTIACAGIYTILIDHDIYEEGIFLEGEGTLSANLAFLSVGEHNVTIIVEDGLGGLTQYEVIIEVTGAGGFVPGYDVLILIMIFGCSVFLLSQYTKRKIRKSTLKSN